MRFTPHLSLLVQDAESGALAALQTVSTLPGGWLGTKPARPFAFYAVANHASAILVAPGGRFVLASNRGHDSIVVFRRADGDDGALALVGHFPSGGRLPWNMAWVRLGGSLFLLVQNQFAAAAAGTGAGAGTPAGAAATTAGSDAAALHTSAAPPAPPAAAGGGGNDRAPPRDPGNVVVLRFDEETGDLRATAAKWERAHVMAVLPLS